jgi:hypothetical protein
MRNAYLSALLLAGTLVLVCSACSDDEQTECITRENCAVEQVCINKQCVQPAGDGTCTSDDACAQGEVCIKNQCTPIGDDPDAGNDSGRDTGTNDGGPRDTGTDNGDPDTPIDTVPPEVVRVIPAAGATGIATDANIIITFSEAVREFGLANKIVVANVDTNETVRIVATLDGPVVDRKSVV